MKDLMSYVWDKYSTSYGVVFYIVKKEDHQEVTCFVKEMKQLPTIEEIQSFSEVKANLQKIVDETPYDKDVNPNVHEWVTLITQKRMSHIAELLAHLTKVYGKKEELSYTLVDGGIGLLVVDLLTDGLEESKGSKHFSGITTVMVNGDQISIWNEGENVLINDLNTYYAGSGYKELLKAIYSSLPMSQTQHPPKIIKYTGMHDGKPKTVFLTSYGDVEERYIQKEQPKENYGEVEALKGARLVFPFLLRTTLIELWEKRIKTEKELVDTGVISSNLPVRIWNWCNYIYPNLMNKICLLEYSTLENDPENPRNPVLIIERPKDEDLQTRSTDTSSG